jgi:hypothetical protein
MDPIRFVAAVQKVQTLVDGGIRVTLDLPESAVLTMAELAAIHVHGVSVKVEISPEDDRE